MEFNDSDEITGKFNIKQKPYVKLNVSPNIKPNVTDNKTKL